MKSGNRLCVVLLLIVVLCSCTAAPSSGLGTVETVVTTGEYAALPVGENLYVVPCAESFALSITTVVDQAGNPVLQDGHFKVLYDVVTGQAQAIEEIEYIEEENQARLYNVYGELIWDWQPCIYSQGTGSCVIKTSGSAYTAPAAQYDSCSLVDMTNGETVLAGVTQGVYGQNGTILWRNTQGSTLYITDETLLQKQAFEQGRYLAEAGDYFIAGDKDQGTLEDPGRLAVLDAAFQPLTSYEANVGYSWIGGNYFVKTTGGADDRTLVSFPLENQGLALMPDEFPVACIDNSVLVMFYSSTNEYALCHTDGVPFTGNYDFLAALGTQSVVGYEGDVLFVLDIQANPQAEIQVQSIESCRVQEISGEPCVVLSAGAENATAAVYSAALTPILQEGLYTWIEYFNTCGLFVAIEAGADQTTKMLLRADGTLVLENVGDVYYSDSRCLVVSHKNAYVLIDNQGNELYRSER